MRSFFKYKMLTALFAASFMSGVLHPLIAGPWIKESLVRLNPKKIKEVRLSMHLVIRGRTLLLLAWLVLVSSGALALIF
jgi:hypothetical protein